MKNELRDSLVASNMVLILGELYRTLALRDEAAAAERLKLAFEQAVVATGIAGGPESEAFKPEHMPQVLAARAAITDIVRLAKKHGRKRYDFERE